MTTLAIGSSVTLTTTDGAYVTVVTNGGAATVAVTTTAGSSYTDSIGPGPFRKRYGPFAEGGSVTISNLSAYLDYESTMSGGGTSPMSASALASAALAGTLSAGTIYFDSTTGIFYLAASSTSYSALSTTAHLGAITMATLLAVVSPTTGMTADITDILPSGEPIRVRWNGSAWKAQQQARVRLRAAGAVSTSAQYPTGTRWALPTGAVGLFTSLQVKKKFELTDSPDTDTVTSWRVKLGTAGTAADTDILISNGTPMAAGDNQRTYSNTLTFESATSVRCDGSSASSNPSDATGSGLTAVGAAAATVSNINSSALYLGVDYTMGASTNAATLTATYTLLP